MSSSNSRHALVLGASGISGWAFVDQLLRGYPRPGVWGRVTGVTRRPMSDEEVSFWPESEKLRLVSGLDLHDDSEGVLREKFMRDIPDVDGVTQVYYLVQDPPANMNDSEPFAACLSSLRKVVTVIENLAPKLEFIHLQYGTFLYGVCFTEDFYHPVPLVESLPPLRKPLSDMLHYPVLTNWMREYSAGKSWKWCETRPDEVIGFVPRPNSYNDVYPVAVFLSLYAYINGNGAECAFPGSFGAWKALSNDAGAGMIAKASIHLSLLKEESVNGEGFNVASSATPWNWEMKWPAICAWFGLVGTTPVDNEKDKTKTPGPDGYIRMHEEEYRRMVAEHGLKVWNVVSPSMDGSDNWGLTKLNSHRQIDLRKLKDTGFMEDESPRETWTGVFELMRKAKIIP